MEQARTCAPWKMIRVAQYVEVDILYANALVSGNIA